MQFEQKAHGLTDAIIYTRVSSQAQIEKGQGAESQETYCRQYSSWKGYQVWGVFFDKGVSGARIDREGIQDVLSFLRKHKKERQFVVVIDDISRLARDIRVHLDLRDAIDECGAILESPAMTFGKDADGRHWENSQALAAQWYREKNRETTINRQAARLLGGYWPQKPPLGYVQKKFDGHGNVLVPVEPIASIIQQALEGYASGRFDTQAEVARFLESHPAFPKNRHGVVTNEAANRVLTRLVYAGYVDSPTKGISAREGKHEGLITLETFNRIQEKLKGRAYVAARPDVSADFPLRGFVRCTCGKPLTSCWSTSKTGAKHPYYMCYNKACGHNRKSIPRTKIEGDFEAVLKGVQPSKKKAAFARAVFKKAWDYHHANALEIKDTIRKRIAELELETSALLDRILKVSNDAVIAKFEEKIATLETEKLAMAEKLHQNGPNYRPFEEMFELAMRFLSSPWNIWENGRIEHRRTVLKLTFAEPPHYDRFEGFRTPKTSMIFSALEGNHEPNAVMAERQSANISFSIVRITRKFIIIQLVITILV